MVTVPKTISITETHEAWINTRVASGDYGNASDYIRDLIRRDKKQHTQMGAIRAALIASEESGISNQTPEEIRKAVQKRLSQNGQLPLNS